MAELVSEGRIYHRRLFTRVAAPFCSQLAWINQHSNVAHDSGYTPRGHDSRLYRVSIRASESSGHVAKPAVTSASPRSVIALGSRHSHVGCRVQRHDDR